MKTNRLSRFAIPYVIWMALFVVAPIIMVVIYAFSSASGGFTLDNFAKMGTYTVVFTRSFKLALIATAICVLIGYPVSYKMSKEGPRFQRLAMVLIMLPMWINFLLRTYSWMAILENNGESWIKYYNTDGTEIASSHPNMDSPGYPMDLSLSADGLWMAVSYAYEDGGKMKSQVAFYNFGSRGEDLVDNLASSSSYTDMLCPQIETAGTSSWVAFFDNGFRVYEGTNKPKETVSVSEDGEILSCAYADDRVVLILRGESDDHPYRMKIYNLKGKQLADENLDFYYQNLQIEEKQILLTNRQELCVYTLNGRKKYSGVVSETQIHEILGMGQNRYLLAEEDGVSMIRLK